MRCPKCGFISFDQISECLKCGKDISSASSSVMGSVRNVVAPTFLKLDNETRSEAPPKDLFGSGVDDYVDEDLEVLVEAEETEDEAELDMELAEDDEGDSELETEAEDDEIEIDMSQFEVDSEEEALPSEDDQADEDDLPELSLDEEEEVSAPAFEVPEELSDISDLAPPAAAQPAEVEVELEEIPPGPTDEPDDDLLLGDLDLDLDLDGEAVKPTTDTSREEETILSLDDLDFSDALGTSEKSKKTDKKGDLDMDEDLDFDLDLGGLSIHEDL